MPHEEVCDPYGIHDCIDGSDQQNCEFEMINSTIYAYKCVTVNICNGAICLSENVGNYAHH